LSRSLAHLSHLIANLRWSLRYTFAVHFVSLGAGRTQASSFANGAAVPAHWMPTGHQIVRKDSGLQLAGPGTPASSRPQRANRLATAAVTIARVGPARPARPLGRAESVSPAVAIPMARGLNQTQQQGQHAGHATRNPTG